MSNEQSNDQINRRLVYAELVWIGIVLVGVAAVIGLCENIHIVLAPAMLVGVLLIIWGCTVIRWFDD